MPRPMLLSYSGWYPSSNQSCEKIIIRFIDEEKFIEGKIPISCIVPHAGWYFCGELSVNCIRILKEKNGDIDNVIIFGGHLSELNLPILETFDYAETPFGKLKNNQQILNYFKDNEHIQKIDYLQDNTIEVLLPIVHYFFGDDITITAIYLPPNVKIKNLIEDLYQKFGQRSVFIGSTDLTHYGPNYNFFHNDKNIDPINWVKTVNDKQYIDLLINMKGEESINYALKNKSACSSGAAFGALTAGQLAKAKSGTMIGYSTSYDKHKDSSFVGYTGIMY
jgi:AmmeMemoRadiSam system protein B